jgi:hypothetical protein
MTAKEFKKPKKRNQRLIEQLAKIDVDQPKGGDQHDTPRAMTDEEKSRSPM